MLFSNTVNDNYKIINHRNVDKMIDVEFLQDLYSQVDLEINPVRFRNIISIYRDGIFQAYAPEKEWNFLQEYVGNKFLEKDRSFLIGLNHYIEFPKTELKKLLKSIAQRDLNSDSPKILCHTLIKLHFCALNEIYGINLVQIEEGLHYAIKKFLQSEQNFGTDAFNWLLGDSHSILTDAIELKVSLSEKKRKGLITNKEAEQIYTNQYGGLETAYGNFKEKNSNNEKEKQFVKDTNKESFLPSYGRRKDKIAFKNMDLAICLRNYSSKIFELRDKNKFLMGQVSTEKNRVFNTLLSKLKILPQEGKFYMLMELYKAVYEDYRVSKNTIKERSKGVVLSRKENIKTEANSNTKLLITNFASKTSNSRTLKLMRGVPVSRGLVIGKAHLVNDSTDSNQLKKGEILVAPGTDFNLVDSFYECAGSITEEGGILSHASIVARELKKPCLVGIKNLIRKIQNKDNLILNGTIGLVANLRDINVALIGTKIDAKIFGSKVARLSLLKRKGYPVLDGIAISFDPKKYNLLELNEILYKSTVNMWKTKFLIIRSSSSEEDGLKFSMAGKYESIKCSNNFNSFTKTLRKMEKANHLQIFIQPYIASSLGGVSFL